MTKSLDFCPEGILQAALSFLKILLDFSLTVEAYRVLKDISLLTFDKCIDMHTG
jgi:hypothetical protein